MAEHSFETPHTGSHFTHKQNPRSSQLPSFDDADDKIMGTGTISARSAAATRHVAKVGRTRHYGRRTRAAQAQLGRATEHNQYRRRAVWPRVIVSLVLVVLVVFGALRFIVPLFEGKQSTENSPHIEAGKQVTLTIPEGAGASSIIAQLVEAGVISDQGSFATALQQQGADSKIKPGTYTFVTGSKDQNVIDLLLAGPNASENTLTIPEGSTVAQTASYVEKSLKIPAADFTAQAKASHYVKDFAFLKDAAATKQDSLEGYLYPKTYNFDGKEISADAVIRTMLNQYQEELKKVDFKAAEAQLKAAYKTELSDYDVLKLASIIEKEALKDEQRPKISSVFYNRLKLGMALQSDTTMAYALGHEITVAEDNHQDSPYNSYDTPGISIPTPICSPALGSVQAALEPASTDFLYFWITQKAERFSKTAEEHNSSYNEQANS